MDLLKLVEFYKWTDTKLQDVIETISDSDFTFKNGGHRSLRELIEHYTVSYQYLSFSGDYAERIIELADITRNELLHQWQEARGKFADILPTLDQQTYYVKMANDEQNEVDRDDYVLLHTDHLTYHRGQISSKIRELGYVPPNTDYWSYLTEIM